VVGRGGPPPCGRDKRKGLAGPSERKPNQVYPTRSVPGTMPESGVEDQVHRRVGTMGFQTECPGGGKDRFMGNGQRKESAETDTRWHWNDKREREDRPEGEPPAKRELKRDLYRTLGGGERGT